MIIITIIIIIIIVITVKYNLSKPLKTSSF